MAQNEASAAAVGGNNNNDDGSIIVVGRQYSDHPQYQPLMLALNSKKYAPLQRKREVVLLFRPSELDDVERYCRDPVLYREYFRHLLDDIGRNTVNRNQISKNLTQAYTAEMLADLFVLNEWNSQLVDNRRPSRSDPSVMVKKAFASLSELGDTVLVAYSDDQKKKPSTKSKVNLQQTGIQIQDTYPFDPLNDVATEPCPSIDCQHFYCLAVRTEDEVKEAQEKKDRDYQQRLTAWMAKPATTRGGKPRSKKSECMELACFCAKIHCSYRLDGGNCPKCRSENGSMVYTGGDGKSHCRCDICNCKCEIKFSLHDRRKIALQMEQEKWMGSSSSSSGPPTNTPSFFASVIQGSLQQGAIDASQDPSSNLDDTAMVYQNATSLAAGIVTANPQLQSNVRLRNEMQKQLPCTTMTTNGLSMKQLRKREKAGLVTPSAQAMTGIASFASKPFSLSGVDTTMMFSLPVPSSKDPVIVSPL